MALEVVERLIQEESNMEARKALAAAEARRIVEEAERSGREALEDLRKEMAEEGRDLLRRAEKDAAVRTSEIQEAAWNEGASMRQSAEKQQEAAKYVFDRVVKG